MQKKKIVASIGYAIIATFLFYKKDLGINLLLFELLVILYLIATQQLNFHRKQTVLVFSALIVSLIATVINYSTFSYIIHFMVAFVFVGLLIYPYARSLATSLRLSLLSTFSSQKSFVTATSQEWNNRIGFSKRIVRVGIFIVPVFVVALFFLMYQKSNVVFERLFAVPMAKLQAIMSLFFENLDVFLVFTFLFGLFICNVIFFRKGNKQLIEKDETAGEDLIRKRTKGNFSHLLSLKNEYRAAVFLFTTLNLLLLLLNITDVYAVWFHFEWKGQYLKQYVHEGTYLLIISIIVSIVIVLYYFRGNLNHYPRQPFLKKLALIWIAQNALLVVSVAIRNFWYIHYFALAYKRIGVYIFLALTLFGLYSVWVKVNKKKTAFYLYRVNALAWLVVLTISAAVNWDVWIAKYNFSKSGKAFLHLEFLATLPDKTLPYLDKPPTELATIDAKQKTLFHFEESFMTPEQYFQTIQARKQSFIQKWKRKELLEWNFAEWRAYKMLQ